MRRGTCMLTTIPLIHLFAYVTCIGGESLLAVITCISTTAVIIAMAATGPWFHDEYQNAGNY